MSDLLREIDEDVAKQKSEQFLEKWGLPIGLFLVILIGGLFFYFNWIENRQAKALGEADAFGQALNDQANKPDISVGVLTDLLVSNSGFSDLAAFKIGDSLWANGQGEEAIAAWQAYVADANANPELANVTRFKLLWLASGQLPEAEITAYLDTLAASEAYSDYIAVLNAVVALEAGDQEGALAELDALIQNQEALPKELAAAVAALARTL